MANKNGPVIVTKPIKPNRYTRLVALEKAGQDGKLLRTLRDGSIVIINNAIIKYPSKWYGNAAKVTR